MKQNFYGKVFNSMLFKGKKNQLMQNRQNRSTDHTRIQACRQGIHILVTLKVFDVIFPNLLKIFTMHGETAQLLLIVLEFDKNIKFLLGSECLSSVPHSDHIALYPMGTSCSLPGHYVPCIKLNICVHLVPWSTMCGPLFPLSVHTYKVQSLGTMTTSLYI
jgi:hypothetical protein